MFELFYVISASSNKLFHMLMTTRLITVYLQVSHPVLNGDIVLHTEKRNYLNHLKWKNLTQFTENVCVLQSAGK